MGKRRLFVGITDHNRLQYKVSPKVASDDGLPDVKVYQNGREIGLLSHDSSGEVILSESLDLRLPCYVRLADCAEARAIPTAVFDSPWFAERYHYEGDDLGAVISGEETTFKVWAPTASAVTLDLYTAGDGVEAYRRAAMRAAADWRRSKAGGRLQDRPSCLR